MGRPWEASAAFKRRASGRFVNGALETKPRRGRSLLLAPSRTCDKRCPKQSGWGEDPFASDRDGMRPRQCGSYAHPGLGPLTRDLSTGRAPTRRAFVRKPHVGPSAATRGMSCPGGRPPERCAGFERSVGRARRSNRLQKSTCGARPIAPAGEEPAEHVGGSSHGMREQLAWRTSVGSRVPVAKPGDRWRAPNLTSLRRESGLREHDVDGRRSGPGKSSFLTGRGRQRSWFLERGSRYLENSRGATGSVRGVHYQPCRGRKHRGSRERCPEAALGSAQK